MRSGPAGNGGRSAGTGGERKPDVWLIFAILYVIYLVVAVPVVAAVAFAYYAVVVPGGYLITLARVLARRPAWLPEPPRAPKLPAGADPAVPQYFYGPAAADADQAVRLAYDFARKRWKSGAKKALEWFDADSATVFTAPLGVGWAAGMAAGTVAGALAATACGVIQLLAVGLSAGAVRGAGAVLRAVDSGILRLKHIKMSCPVCFERVPYPGYVCPNARCKHPHRDVRPGRFGILRRRCECGTPMKTLLLFGSARMAAFCPHCDHLLEHRPGEAPEVVLPFFGAAGAGKTRLLFSVVTQLQAWGEEGEETKLTAEFADSVTTRELAAAADILRYDRTTSATLPELPRAHVIRLITGRTTRILHLFDAAGERFYTAERTRELGYLGKARTFVLVIDPLSVDSFWQRLTPERQAELAPLRSAAPSPELAYQQAHQAIEGMGVNLRAARIAVVFSKADKTGPPDGDVADWADRDLRLGNLVRSARLQFKEAHFTCAAAVMTKTGMDPSIAKLLRWMLADEGVTLPGEAS
jgi:Double-GTPase 2